MNTEIFIPDFSKYTLVELEEIYSKIQKDNFPERVEAIENEIKRKKELLIKDPTVKNILEDNNHIKFVGFWKRALIAMIDTIIGLSFFPLSSIVYSFSFTHKTIIPIIIHNLLFIFVMKILCVKYFGGTPGKLLLKVRIINEEGKYLGFGSAIFRVSPYLILSIFQHLQINHAFQSAPSYNNTLGYIELTKIIGQYGGIYAIISMILNYFVFFDVGAVLFNKHKRTLHDYLASSYVITKDSYLWLKEFKNNLKNT